MHQPMQPLERDKHGVVRFRENKIVNYMLACGETGEKFDLNKIAVLPFDVDDRMQLAMLIGYSVSGFGDLSYADGSVVAQADLLAEELLAKSQFEMG